MTPRPRKSKKPVSMPPGDLYTVGYCVWEPTLLLDTLRKRSIGAVIDVRGMPEISRFPVYRGSNFKRLLNDAGFYYLSLANELGARPADKKFYVNGKADFDLIAASESFLAGCNRVRAGLEKFSLCLACAQKDPLNCHRSVLITHRFRYLYPEIKIFHLMPPNAAIPQGALDDRLLKARGYDQGILGVNNREELLNRAYAEQSLEIAYSPDGKKD